MARRGQFIVKTTEADGREFLFYTVVGSEAQAEANFRRQHPRWRRPIEVIPPAFPAEKGKGKKK